MQANGIAPVTIYERWNEVKEQGASFSFPDLSPIAPSLAKGGWWSSLSPRHTNTPAVQGMLSYLSTVESSAVLKSATSKKGL